MSRSSKAQKEAPKKPLGKTKNTTGGVQWLKRLGRVPAAPRDTRPVEYK